MNNRGISERVFLMLQVNLACILAFVLVPICEAASNSTMPSTPLLADADRLAVRELQLKAERAMRVYMETPAYKAFLSVQVVLAQRVKDITPEGFQLTEDPQTGDLKFAALPSPPVLKKDVSKEGK